MAERATPFGKYFLLERINVGGMAEVFKAKTFGASGFEKIVAIKRVLPAVAQDEEFIRMFVDEAKITSDLTHASLAQTFDLGQIDGTWYIAMEYVRGKDLRAVFERMKRRGTHVPLRLAASIIARVCEGLDYAHRKRDALGRELHIVHRDVSPQNIVLSYDGEVKLIDFGVAKAAHGLSRTQTGILKGKFGYMSPEQVRGLEIDRRSDVFSAGIVLYELCTGQRLFTGSSDATVLEKVQEANVAPPSRLDPAFPPALEAILLKALARTPEERFQSAAELASELQRFAFDGGPVTRDDLAAFMRETFGEEPSPDQPQPTDPPAAVEPGADEPVERTQIVPSPLGPPAAEGPPATFIVRSQAGDLPDLATLSDEKTEVRPRRVLFRNPAVRRTGLAACALLVGLAVTAALHPPRAFSEPREGIRADVAPAVPPLRVLSAPAGATVFIDGVRRGETPADLGALDPANAHAIVLEKGCYRSWQLATAPGPLPRNLVAHLARAGEECPVEPAAPVAAPELGHLSLASRPGANVVVDGVDIGRTTPLLAWPLHPGRHAVEVIKGERHAALDVDIEAGRTQTELVELRAAKRSGVR